MGSPLSEGKTMVLSLSKLQRKGGLAGIVARGQRDPGSVSDKTKSKDRLTRNNQEQARNEREGD